MLQFIIGLLIGGTFGVFTMCLLVSSKRGEQEDFHIDTLNREDGASGE